MTQKQEYCVYIEVLYILESQFWKVRAGVSGFLTFENIWHDWNYMNANNFLGFKTPKKYACQILQYFRSRCWKNDMFSFLIETSHLHIAPKWLCQSELGYTTLHFFSKQHTHDHIDFALVINIGGRTWKTMWFQHNIYIFISISISGVCRLGHCTTFVKCQGWYTICWDDWGTKATN